MDDILPCPYLSARIADFNEVQMITSSVNLHSFLSGKLEGRSFPGKGGKGVFATERVEKGEILTVWGGIVVPGSRFFEFTDYARTHSIQVEEDLYLMPLTGDDPADYFNHSCDPNAGLYGQISLVAMRVIEKGEEVCFDYAMSDSNPYDEFECSCGSPNCRGKITADDWALPDLQKRYEGYFTPYLQRRMDQNK
jgi:uncharacterized protein